MVDIYYWLTQLGIFTLEFGFIAFILVCAKFPEDKTHPKTSDSESVKEK